MTNFQACKGCTRRHKNCHSDCIDYLTEKTVNSLQNLKQRKEAKARLVSKESERQRIFKLTGKKYGE